MDNSWHFPVLILVSLIAFVGVLRLVLRGRTEGPQTLRVLWVAAIVVVGGMSFAKLGASTGLPVWAYYKSWRNHEQKTQNNNNDYRHPLAAKCTFKHYR